MHHSTQYATLQTWLVLVIFFSAAVIALCVGVALITRITKFWLVVKIACMLLLLGGILLAVVDHMGFA
jgi:hypothetical protein